jgi:hypothetical protein
MKKPFIIFSVFIIAISFLVFSCSTKNDPPVPVHTSNVTNVGNSITFGAYNFSLGFRSCSIDTSNGKHFSMVGNDLNSGFSIGVLFYDSITPTAMSASYTVVNSLTTPTLSDGQCYILVSAPTVSPNIFYATDGTLNLNIISGSLTASITGVPVKNSGDATTSTITGSWNCQ